MAGPKLFASSNLSSFLHNETLPSSSSSHILDSFLFQHSDPSSFQGSKHLVDFENVSGGTISELPFFQGLDKEENTTEDEFDGCFHQAGKKRRLTGQQVQLLEKNFEVENKLEPERKVQLAKELGLQPRQVAIWFQNRRARFKTKQLEKDYTTLKSSYDKLKDEHESLLHQKDKLKEEVNSLKNRLKEKDQKEKEESNNTNGISKNRSKVEKVTSSTTTGEKIICKQLEDANSAKSDVFDSESPHHTADSSHAYEAEHSDFSPDEEDNNNNDNLLNLPCLLPKVEEEPCNFGFPSYDDQAFHFWSY